MKTRLGLVSNSSSSCFIIQNKRFAKPFKVKVAVEELLERYNTSVKESLYIGNLMYITQFTEEDRKELEEDFGSHQIPKIAGGVMIRSSSDNSIPNELDDMIEEFFNVDRIRLG